MNANQREIHSTVSDGMHRVSWGAVFAGLVGTLALLWLLLLLGSALGVSILDATDAAALGSGLGWGAVIWLIVSFLVAYFSGGAIAGRLACDPTNTGGMLHGVTVWSTATVLSLVLSAWGIGGTASLATHAAGNVTKASSNVVMNAGETLGTTGQLVSQFAGSELAEEMTAALKSVVAERLSDSAEGVGQQETRQAISEIDNETVTAVSRHLVAGDTDQAVQRLSQSTNLSRSDITEIINSLQSEIESAVADSAMLAQLQAGLRAQLDDALQAAAEFAGPSLTASELRTALNQLDGETLAEIATHLMQGEEDRARNVLTSNTSLSDQEVNSVIDEVSSKFEQQLEEWKGQAEKVIETAADYTQMALWSLFLASLLALLAAMFGGGVGAGRSRR